jgi:hypothetical protein
MGGPADLRFTSEAPLRLFAVKEANALVPQLEEGFLRLDPKLARVRELRELIEDAEAYYGKDLAVASPEDRKRHEALVQERDELDRSVQADIEDIQSFGCEVKDLNRGLVDFPARMGDEVAYLCWQRGENRIAWWHTLQGGFAERKALATEAER